MKGIKEDMREGMKKDMRDYMPDDMQEEILRRIALKKKSREGMGRLFSHPLDMLTEKPENVLIISVPLALTVFIADHAVMRTSFVPAS